MKEDFIDQVFNEECLQGLKSLPDNSVDCCVTSPPYYALRDYGTGHWEGGDPNCPHYRTSKVSENTATGHKAMMDSGHPVGDAIYKSVCPLCGAIRIDEQIGLEETPEEYIRKLTEVFMEVHRVLKPEGTLWLNIGDSYNGSGGNHKDTHKNDTVFQGSIGVKYGGKGAKVADLKPKDLIGVPWMLAFSLRNAGWYLRQDIIWSKSNPMPESVKDRCTKSHEYIFLLSKSPKYYYDYEAIQEPATYDGRNDTMMHGGDKYKAGVIPDGKQQTMACRGHERWQQKDGEFVRNKRSVWSVATRPDNVAHFATYPEELITPCILAGCPSGGIVLDPFMGSGTTARVARKFNRHYVGFELNTEYMKIIKNKIRVEPSLFD